MDTAFAVWLLSRSGETAGSYFPSHWAGIEPELSSFGGLGNGAASSFDTIREEALNSGSFASSFAFRRNINPLTAIPKTTQTITFTMKFTVENINRMSRM